ncbi:MAG: TrkH family potassium uptake protein [Candidatus Rifleibacteriota bacterium]
MVISLLFFFMADTANSFAVGALMTSAFFSQILAIVWSVRQQSNFHKLACVLINFLFMTANIYLSQKGLVWLGTLATGFSMVIFLPDSSQDPESMSRWWEPLIYHPGRVTLVTFFLLCVFGTFLLILPSAANNLRISLIDAAFTSVSSVCVTGLIVLDTPNDFSNLGQFFILILIQLGGLGIMTVTSVALHAMGQRLSIKQERILSSSAATENLTLAESLLLIVKFTFFVEFAGALILTYLFLKTGLSAKEALWKGVFTAVSAFCNAGFSLQTDSLIQYQTNAAILHTVGLLIIMGGIAPAVNLSIIRFITGKQVPVASRIALTTTIVLLILGTFFFLAFEWNGALAGLSIADKFHNAWFQSVTLRTAGFNSIAIENVTGPTFIIMLCMMFIGGSPGGTAGGVKTTTLGVLAATFWACITGNEDISMQNRRILPESVFKAVTIVASGALVLLLTTLMLEITQSIGSRDIVFEATSALGTVGLSTGATSCLDSIGKIIIMFAMFAGRIGPVTLFSILGRERSSSNDNYLDAKINLT